MDGGNGAGDHAGGGGIRRPVGSGAHAAESEPAVARRAAGATRPPVSWRRNLWALWIAQMLAIVGFSLRVPFLPFYLADLGASSTDEQAIWAGLINAGGAGVMAITAPIWGAVADRRGRKPMLLRSMFAAMVTIALMGLATAPWHLVGLRLLEGALTGTVTAATALVAATAPKDRLGFSLGMIQTAVFSGSSLGPLFGGVLADQIGYRATFLVGGAMLGASGLIVLLVVKERFVPPTTPRAGRGGRRAAIRATLGLVLGGTMLTLTLTMLVLRFAASAVQPIVPLFVAQLDGAGNGSASVAGLALGVLGLTSAVSAIFFGRRGDRTGHRRILLGCAAGAGLLYLPMALVQSAWQLIVLQALFGVAAGGLVPSANALIADRTAPERRGVVFGLTAAAAAFGGFLGPLVGSGLAAAAGFPVAFLFTGATLLGLAVTIAVTLPAGGRRQAAGGRTGTGERVG